MDTNDKIKILRQSPIFSGLNEAEFMDLADLAMERRLQAGEFLFREDEEVQFFYILAEGKLKTFLDSSLGKELALITFWRPGETLGPTSIFRNRPSSGSLQAMAETVVLGFKKVEAIAFILDHPLVSLEIIKVLAARVSELNRRLRDVTGERVEQRLFRVMLTLSRREGTTFNITRQELADMVGATTETIIRIMSSLKKKKIIASARGEISILDESKLRSLSEGS